jgi:hypothetical protein
MMLQAIQIKVRSGDYRLSSHAVKRMIEGSIGRLELEEAILSGEIIEQYGPDTRGASCLIYGRTNNGRNVHAVVSLSPNVVVITAYEPDASRWIDYRVRR